MKDNLPHQEITAFRKKDILKALILCCEPYRYGVRREVDETSSRFYKC
jgi:hypothetical protein